MGRRQPAFRLVLLGILTAFGALILLGGRSEMIRGLRGDGRDERFRMIDIHASALAGLAVITAIIIAFVVELARVHDGTIRVSQVAAKYGEHAPVATACCNAYRACVTSNIVGITLGVIAAAGAALRRRFARRAALTDR